MISRQKRILFTILSGIVVLLAGTISTSYVHAQNTPDFSGTWNTVTSTGKTLVVTLKATNRRSDVTGSYNVNGLTSSYQPLEGPANGFVKVSAVMAEPLFQNMSRISGTVKDNVLRFTWQEDGGSGAGRFTISSDGESFEGTFSRTGNPDDTSGGTWNGTRMHPFAGAWQGKLGESFIELVLQQNGYQVTGELNLNSVHLLISDGIVEGNILRFKVMRTKILGKPDQLGSGELMMEKGGKSFTGTVLGAATSGTLISRPRQ